MAASKQKHKNPHRLDSNPAARRLVGASDAKEVGRLLLGLPFAWFVPEAIWPPVCNAVAALATLVKPGVTRERVEHLRLLVGKRGTAFSAEVAHKRRWSRVAEARLQGFRDMRPGGWKPRIELIGSSHIERALRRGGGAILWVGGFSYGTLVTKMAMHRAGFGVHHLSSPLHGFTSSRFGRHVLNGLWTRVEDRYLARRIKYTSDTRVGALRALSRSLNENKIISMTVGDSSDSPIATPFLEGEIRLATGGPRLALSTGAHLLPVFTVRRDNGVFDVIVEPPLSADPTEDRSTQIFSILSDYAALLEPYTRAYPDQWDGWSLVDPL